MKAQVSSVDGIQDSNSALSRELVLEELDW
jgi:hypothetical protein